MSEFIRIEIEREVCVGVKKCGKCIHVCPVGIFVEEGDYPQSLESNEDECTLCNLCLESCKKGALSIRKLYEE